MFLDNLNLPEYNTEAKTPAQPAPKRKLKDIILTRDTDAIVLAINSAKNATHLMQTLDFIFKAMVVEFGIQDRDWNHGKLTWIYNGLIGRQRNSSIGENARLEADDIETICGMIKTLPFKK